MTKKLGTAYVPSSNYKGENQVSTSIKNIDLSIYSLNSQQIGGQSNANDGTATVYSVPKGYTLFITSVNLQTLKWETLAGVNAIGTVSFKGQPIIQTRSPFPEGESAGQAFSFSIPFILSSEEKITVTANGTYTLALAGFTGFLVKNQDLRY